MTIREQKQKKSGKWSKMSFVIVTIILNSLRCIGLDLAEVFLCQNHAGVQECRGRDGFVEVAERLLVIQRHHLFLCLGCHLDGGCLAFAHA